MQGLQRACENDRLDIARKLLMKEESKVIFPAIRNLLYHGDCRLAENVIGQFGNR